MTCAVHGCTQEPTIKVPEREMLVCEYHATEGIGLAETVLKFWKIGMPKPLATCGNEHTHEYKAFFGA